MVRQGANRLAATAPELYYEQVLDNLARSHELPDELPYFATPNQGTHQNARTIQATWTPGWDFITTTGVFAGNYLFDKQTAALQGTNQNQVTYQMSPLSDPDKLTLINAALHEATGTATPGESCLLDNWYYRRSEPVPSTDPRKPPTVNLIQYHQWRPQYGGTTCWVQFVEKRRKIPKDACHVGHYNHVYAYVVPGCESQLTEFTLAILDIATLDGKGGRPLGSGVNQDLYKKLDDARAKQRAAQKRKDDVLLSLKRKEGIRKTLLADRDRKLKEFDTAMRALLSGVNKNAPATDPKPEGAPTLPLAVQQFTEKLQAHFFAASEADNNEIRAMNTSMNDEQAVVDTAEDEIKSTQSEIDSLLRQIQVEQSQSGGGITSPRLQPGVISPPPASSPL